MISIITPVYKVEKYIHRCVDSVLNQSYIDFELILVDDGSPDNCPAICDEYAKKDSRIKVIHKDNGGSSDARNYGLDICSGDYITFLDSDDFWHKDYLKIMLDYLQKYNADIVQCCFEKGTGEFFLQTTSKNKIKILNKYEALKDYSYKVIPWSKLYKKDIIGNIRFPIGIICEDDATYYKFVYNANKIAIISDILYYYYQSPVSITRNNNNFLKEDFIKVYEERIDFFEDKNEKELVELSKVRYCLVLLLTYLHCRSIKNNTNNTDLFLIKFNLLYKNIDKKYISAKLKILFYMFIYCKNLLFVIYKLKRK